MNPPNSVVVPEVVIVTSFSLSIADDESFFHWVAVCLISRIRRTPKKARLDTSGRASR